MNLNTTDTHTARRAPVNRKPRRALTPAQAAVLPLAPIFQACKHRGLKITPDNKTERLYQVNSYLNNFDGIGFDWIETSFKELIGNVAAIIVLADAIEAGALSWGIPVAPEAALQAAPKVAPVIPFDELPDI